LFRGVSRRTARRTDRRVSRAEVEWYANQFAPVQAPPVTEEDEAITEKLREITKLHDEGHLTDEEFVAKKRQILGI
jgi:hypothetical protein